MCDRFLSPRTVKSERQIAQRLAPSSRSSFSTLLSPVPGAVDHQNHGSDIVIAFTSTGLGRVARLLPEESEEAIQAGEVVCLSGQSAFKRPSPDCLLSVRYPPETHQVGQIVPFLT